MQIIAINALSNGAHANQNGTFNTAPEGYAVIPSDMVIPATFPFVDIEVQDGIVTAMTANRTAYNAAMAEAAVQQAPQPTQLDRVEAQTMYTALLTDTLIEEVV